MDWSSLRKYIWFKCWTFLWKEKLWNIFVQSWGQTQIRRVCVSEWGDRRRGRRKWDSRIGAQISPAQTGDQSTLDPTKDFSSEIARCDFQFSSWLKKWQMNWKLGWETLETESFSLSKIWSSNHPHSFSGDQSHSHRNIPPPHVVANIFLCTSG